MFFNQLSKLLMDNFEKIVIEKDKNKITIPMRYELGSFSLFYNIEVIKSEIDENWFDVIRKVKSNTNYVGKIKEGATDDEIVFILNDIIKQTQKQALKTANININYLTINDELSQKNKDNYLYCLMDSTTSYSMAGWDVEIFLDNSKSRDSWINSDVGTDAEELRTQFSERLSVFGLFSEMDAIKYIEKLKKIYNLTSLNDISQINN